MREARQIKGDLARLEVRAAPDGEGSIISGYAAVFNRYSQNLGGFVEQVEPSAFNRTLRNADVMALVNHDVNRALGRSSAGTLTLKTDDIGLLYEVNVRTTVGRQAAEEINAGILRGSSFSFSVPIDGEQWGYTDQGFPLRSLRDVELFDVGPVIWPAYLATEEAGNAVALRSLATHRGLPFEMVADAAARNELRSLLDAADQELRSAEGAAEAPETRPVAATVSLASYRRRLLLLEKTATSRAS